MAGNQYLRAEQLNITVRDLEKALEDWETAESVMQGLTQDAPLVVRVSVLKRLELTQYWVADQAKQWISGLRKLR